MQKLASKIRKGELLIFSSRQLGKTFWGLSFAISFAAKNPGTKVLYFAPTQKALQDIIADTMSQLIVWAPDGFIKRHKTSARWSIGQSELRLYSLERSVIDKMSRGTNAHLIVTEEGGFVNSEDYKYAIEAVIRAQRNRFKAPLIHITTPSPDENHYIHTVTLPRCELSGLVARFDIYHNPFMTSEEIEDIKNSITKENWEREYLVKIIRDHTLVVCPEFNPSHIISQPIPKYTNFITSVDFGGVLDPHAILIAYWDFENARLVVCKEKILPINTGTDEIVESAKSLEKPFGLQHPLRVTDSQGQTTVDLGRMGFHTINPEKGNGSWEAGINAIRVAFQQNQIAVDESCVHLIQQLKYGMYTENRKDFKRTKEMGHLDLIAALIYAWRHKRTHNPNPIIPEAAHKDTHYISPSLRKKKSDLNKIFSF